MEEVRGAGGPWTVAGDPQEGGEGGGAGVCVCAGGRGLVLAGGRKKWIQMDRWKNRDEGKVRRLVKDLVER